MADFQGFFGLFIENLGLLSLLRLPIPPRPRTAACHADG
jgi:hypothetical protein